jgi:hypothetical protein
VDTYHYREHGIDMAPPILGCNTITQELLDRLRQIEDVLAESRSEVHQLCKHEAQLRPLPSPIPTIDAKESAL